MNGEVEDGNYKRLRYLLMATDRFTSVPVVIGWKEWIIVLCASPYPCAQNPGTACTPRSYAAHLYDYEAAGQDHGGVANPDKNPVCYTLDIKKKR